MWEKIFLSYLILSYLKSSFIGLIKERLRYYWILFTDCSVYVYNGPVGGLPKLLELELGFFRSDVKYSLDHQHGGTNYLGNKAKPFHR